ncbi:MAG: CAP domain-containing protein [Acidobacteria bacterium]|nr:CAP domain-containing protein [Acidobacteriota bacterium]
MTSRSRPVEAIALLPDHSAPWWLTLRFLLLLAAASVAACGGGSGSPTDPIVGNAAAVESQSFQLINSARGQEGVGLLALDNELSRIARAHSEEMRDRGFFGHRNPEGNGLRSRLKANGVSFSSAGENLALVNDSSNPAGLAHQQLMASPEHRDVMLAGRFVRGGVGVAQSGSNFWITQIYVKP